MSTSPLAPFDDGIDQSVASFALYVEDVLLAAEITEAVVSITYEQTLDMADKCSILLVNEAHYFTAATIFQPGNHLDVWMGYSGTMEFIGRTRIVRHLPTFSTGDVPTLEVIGYGPEAGLGSQELAVTGGPKPRKKGKQHDADERRRVGTVSSIVTAIFEKHNLAVDLTKLDAKVALHHLEFDQKRGTTDLELVQTLANLFGAEFKIEWRVPTPQGSYTVPGTLHKRRTQSGIVPKTFGQWFGVFRTPPKERDTRFFTFVWSRSDTSRQSEGAGGNVLSANLDWGFPDQVTEIEVMYFDAAAFEWKHLSIAEDEVRTAPLYKSTIVERKIPSSVYDVLKDQKKVGRGKVVDAAEVDALEKGRTVAQRLEGGSGHEIKVRTGRTKVRGALSSIIAQGGPALTVEAVGADGEITKVTPLKIAASGFSVEVVPNRRFTSAEDALIWAAEWFKKRKDQFLTGDFEVPGNPLVTAGTVHEFTGLGSRYTGDWYCPTVVHRIDAGSSYITKMTARKVVG